MTAKPDATPWMAAGLLVLAGASLADLHNVETHTLVIYTTPALQEVLTKHIIPAYTKATGEHVEIVSALAASEEYYRIQLGRDHPEADVFLHASPLYIAKGADGGYFDPIPNVPRLPDGMKGNGTGGGVEWAAFGWSPLVEVYSPRFASPPDLATAELRYGMPHPRLSNNGVYAAFLFDRLDPAAGDRAAQRSVVQPTSARATVNGVADGSFDVTLGYEAVAATFTKQGAKVAYGLPVLNGKQVTTPVLFCAGIVRNHPHASAERFVAFLFNASTQALLAKSSIRAVTGNGTIPGGLDLAGAQTIRYDWSQWRDLDPILRRYEVKA